MLLKTFYREDKKTKNEWHWVEGFLYARPLPSGHLEIIYGEPVGSFRISFTHSYNILFKDFVRHRQAGTYPERTPDEID